MQATDAGTLLERERELDELADLVDEACSRRGRLALIEGPPGIGKTRLLDTLRLQARERGMAVLSARASELDREFPFGVIRQMFEPLLAGADETRRAALLHGAAGPAAALLGTGPPDPSPPGADASLSHFHALYWLTANLAEEGPLALAVDDLHCADSSSIRFLEFLLPRIEGLPVLLALAARPESRLDPVAADPLAHVLRPAPLTGDAVAELVGGELRDLPERDFCEACHEATGGNPFLLRELLRELGADNIAPTAEQVVTVRGLAPPTVSRAVLLRLARLGDEASALARAVAVLGDGGPLRRAADLAGLDGERAAEVAAELAQAGILDEERPLAFAHPILRAAVYGDIDVLERAQAHRRAAELLAEDGAGADAVAVHLLETEPGDDLSVVSTLRDAASAALARGAAGTAVACLRRALEEPPAPEDRGSLTLDLASAELDAGDPAAAAEHFDEGLLAFDDPRVRAAISFEQTVALQAVGRHDEAYALRERAAEEVAPVDPELASLVEVSLIATAGLDLTRLDWARGRIERQSAGASVAAPRMLAMEAYFRAFYGDGAEAAQALAEPVERALASGDLVDRAANVTTPFFTAVEVMWLADRAEPARRALDGVMEEARRRGSALAFACASGWRCMVLARDGALAEAEADARSCAELSLRQGWFAMAPPMLGYVLDVLVSRGELDDAERILEGAGMADRPAGDDLALFPVLHARARIRAARGDVAGGRADFAELRRRRARWNTDLTLVPALLAAPELSDDEADRPREHAETMLREARGWDTPRAIGMALRAAGLAEGGRRGIDLLHEAAETLERSPARLEHARALADLGASLRRANRRAQARDPLRRALDIADACGARPLADRARHELVAAGGRPRRPRTTGVQSLTASEARIAAMAADGLSNPEIAQALFVTKKTVEAHLSSVYRKLDIRSRGELAGALR